jgi:hypothetical protein
MRDDQRQRVVVRRANVDEVDVETVDLGHELRQAAQPRLQPPEVVLGLPVAGKCLDRRELDALRQVVDGLLLGQRVAAMRACSASISASAVTGIVNGRIAVAPAEFSVGTDMWVSLLGLVVDVELAGLDGAGAFRGGQAGGG